MKSSIPTFSPIGRASSLAFGSLLLGLILLGSGCSGGGGGAGGPPPDVPVEVQLAKPAVRSVEDVLSAVGTVEANERVELKPKAAGIIESTPFSEGQRLEKGAKLLELDSRKEKASLAQAEAEEQLARSNVARARTLAGTKAISAQELDQLESQVAVRAAARELEHERLAERTLFAPVSGTIGPRLVSPGQFVAIGTPIAVLVDDSKVKIQFRLPERELSRIRIGQAGRVQVAAYGDRTFNGAVDLIDPEVDPSTRTILARLLVTNSEALLRPGMFARVELIAGRHDNALVLPEGALVPSLDRFSVFLSENGRAVSRPVKLGVRLPGQVEIIEGLTAESQVVISGTQKLVEGMKVVHREPTPAGTKPATPAPAHP